MSKYGNTKVQIDGIIFDSKLEGLFYLDLKDMMEKRLIASFDRQVKIEICPKYRLMGKEVRAAHYVLDFVVDYIEDGVKKRAYIDTKGYGTDVSKLKKKLAQYKLGDKVLWLEKNFIYGCKRYGWIDQEELKKIRKANKKKI